MAVIRIRYMRETEIRFVIIFLGCEAFLHKDMPENVGCPTGIPEK